MKFFSPLLALFLFTACATNQAITYQVPTAPQQALQPAPQKVVVLNTFDPSVYSQKNKKELVSQVTDTLIRQMEEQLKSAAAFEVVPVYGITPVFTSADDGSILALIEKHGASHAIVIKEVDLFFNQINVQVTKTESGKNREAFYDICSNIRYDLYSRQQKLESVPVRFRRPHSSRQVISGVLAAGPSLARNSHDFYALAAESKNRFLGRFFPGWVVRSRPLFTTGPFAAVGAAVKQANFDRALKESLRLTESLSRTYRAQAFYNCAVLSERLNQPADVTLYLQRSVSLQPLPQAVQVQVERDQ